MGTLRSAASPAVVPGLRHVHLQPNEHTKSGRVSRATNSFTGEGCRAFPEFFKKNPDVTLELENIKLI